MLAKTHVLGGLAAGMGVATISSYEPLLLIPAATIASLFPDICHKGSTIGKKIPVVSWIVSAIFGHRTFTHSLLFLLLTAWVLTYVPMHEAIRIGVLVGMGSHLILDALTKNGIRFLYPLKINFRFPLAIRTGGAWEPVYAMIFAGLAIYWGMELFGYRH